MWMALFIITDAAAICFAALAMVLDSESRLPRFIANANGRR